jgi:hypothetical protein
MKVSVSGVWRNEWKTIARSNESLGWEGVGNPQLLRFFKAQINWSMLTANLKFGAKKSFFFSFLCNVLH